MDKRAILELQKYILNKINDLYEYYKSENIIETNFSNWNVRDVIGHINSWIKFSEDKLKSIKLKKSFEDVSNIEIFNETNYNKNKNESLENVVNESKILLEKYKDTLDLFDEEELLSNKFPTGFSFALWKYMAMDLGIHPLMHILYHYIKNRDYDKFIIEIENSKKYFMEFSENDIKVYNFNDLFEDKKEGIKRFNELNNVNKNNKFVEEIIRINLE